MADKLVQAGGKFKPKVPSSLVQLGRGEREVCA